MERATSSVAVVEALGTAWTVHSLYPEPELQPAFRRAVEAMRAAVVEPLRLEIDATGFLVDGHLVVADREGADRLAKRCYVHRVETLSITGPPSEAEVARLLAALARDEQAAAASGGIEAALRRSGVSSFAVVQRAQLATGARQEAVERDPAVREIVDDLVTPEEFAQRLRAGAGGDVERLANLMHESFESTLSRVDGEDVAGREAVVQIYVEAFFYFGEEEQLAVFRRFLISDGPDDRLFMDQFAGHELAKLAPRLDSQGLALLLDYARVATDQADGRPRELLSLLRDPEAMQSMRNVAAAKVAERLSSLDRAADEGGRLLAGLRDRFPDPQRFFFDALEVFRGLLAVENRDARFSRLMRIWVGKVAEGIRRGDFRRAELWVRAALGKPVYPSGRAKEVDAALHQICTRELIGIVVEAAASDPSAQRILDALGPRATNTLLDLLADEQVATRRRMLMRVVAQAAANDPAPLLGRLADERWYVVRNVLWALREAGATVHSSALGVALKHRDHRVRVEALRLLAATDPDEAAGHLHRALGDGSAEVRSTAIALLGALPAGEGDASLASAAENRRRPLAERLAAVEALGQRAPGPAREVLRRLAGRRLALTSAARSVRDAARRALGES